MERRKSLTREVRAILSAPTLQRSPTLSRLLEYLLSRDLGGKGAPNQYDIAVEALGKNESFDETTDSSVRVQMSRLRGALADYYLTHQPVDGLYLHIRNGEYLLRSGSLEVAYPDLASARLLKLKSESDEGGDDLVSDKGSNGVEHRTQSDTLPPSASPKPTINSRSALSRVLNYDRAPLRLGIFLATVVASFALVLISSSDMANAESIPRAGLQVPFVSADVNVNGLTGELGSQDRLLQRIDADVRGLLQKSIISRRLPTGSNDAAQYQLSIDVTILAEDRYQALLVLTDDQGKLVTERTIGAVETPSVIVEAIQDEMISIVSPAGHITRDLADNISGAARNDFECFIMFEGSRSTGSSDEPVLEKCIADFADGDFTPYLRIRRAFAESQRQLMTGHAVNPSDPAWLEVSEVLAEYPENTYANTLAAKLLIGRERCTDAAEFAREGFSRGRTYPALELSVIIDAFGCDELASLRPFWSGRIKKVAAANLDPHALLESYILLGVIVSEQEHLLETHKSSLFTYGANSTLSEFNQALRSANDGNATSVDIGIIENLLPSLIFSNRARVRILQRIRSKNAA